MKSRLHILHIGALTIPCEGLARVMARVPGGELID